MSLCTVNSLQIDIFQSLNTCMTSHHPPTSPPSPTPSLSSSSDERINETWNWVHSFGKFLKPNDLEQPEVKCWIYEKSLIHAVL